MTSVVSRDAGKMPTGDRGELDGELFLGGPGKRRLAEGGGGDAAFGSGISARVLLQIVVRHKRDAAAVG